MDKIGLIIGKKLAKDMGELRFQHNNKVQKKSQLISNLFIFIKISIQTRWCMHLIDQLSYGQLPHMLANYPTQWCGHN